MLKVAWRIEHPCEAWEEEKEYEKIKKDWLQGRWPRAKKRELTPEEEEARQRRLERYKREWLEAHMPERLKEYEERSSPD